MCACLYYFVHEFLYVMLIVLVQMSSADVARSHGGDGGGEDRPPPDHVPTGCGGCGGSFLNRGKNFWIIVIQA